MSEAIDIEIDVKEVKTKLKKLKKIPNGTPKALTRALNKTLTGMRTDTKKIVANNYIIKPAEVYKKLDVSDKANYSKLSVSMRSNDRPMRLIHFENTPNERPGSRGAKPVFAKVKHNSSGNYLKGAFIATMKSKNGITGIFVRGYKQDGLSPKLKKLGITASGTRKRKRAEDDGGYEGNFREPIRQLYGPGAVQMLNNEKISNKIEEKAVERFDKAFDNQVNHLLDNGK